MEVVFVAMDVVTYGVKLVPSLCEDLSFNVVGLEGLSFDVVSFEVFVWPTRKSSGLCVCQNLCPPWDTPFVP